MTQFVPTTRESTLALAVITMAADGGMPDSFWETDNRIIAACATLNWTPEYALEWAMTRELD